MEPVLLSIGHGYAAAQVARALPAGWRVIATTRSAERAEALRREGFEALVWKSGDDAGTLAQALEQATHLIASVPPRGAGGDPAAAALAGLSAPRLRWIGYLSASSIYGDAGGGWVDETTPPAPGTDRGRARLEAEAQWQAVGARFDAAVAFMRIAGIYGPGRSALDALRKGRAQRVIRPGQVFNRIHVADLGRIVAAAAVRETAGPFNLCDEEPAAPQDVIACGAALLGLAPPPEIAFEAAALSPMARSFYADNKRLRSLRVGPELGVRLLYPDYRAGLAAILAAEGGAAAIAPPPSGG